jgi:hypothetical protein
MSKDVHKIIQMQCDFGITIIYKIYHNAWYS